MELWGLGYTKQIITLTKIFYLRRMSSRIEGPRGVAPGRVRRAGKMQIAGREYRGWLVKAESPTLPRLVKISRLGKHYPRLDEHT